MDRRIRPLVLSFLAVFASLFFRFGLNSASPDALLYAADDRPAAPMHAARAAFGGEATSRTLDAPAGGPTATPAPTATACTGGAPFDILIVYTDDGPTQLLRGELLAQPNVANVMMFNAYVDTPTLVELQPYDLVVAMGNLDYEDPVALGDNLADYHDGGGVVVPVFGSFFDIEDYAIRGRWFTGGYSPYTYGDTVIATSVTLGSHDPAHPLMDGVDTLNAIVRVELTAAPAATEVAAYSDGSSAVAYKTTGAQTSVGLSAYLGDAGNRATGDYAAVIVNAAEWLVPGGCPTALRLGTMESGGGDTTDFPLLGAGVLGALAGLAVLHYRKRTV